MEDQIGKKRTKKGSPSYLYSMLIITLVLFILGAVGAFIVQAKSISNQLRESLVFQIELSRDANQADIDNLKFVIESDLYAKEVVFVSKEDALKQLIEETGEDPTIFLDENPLYDALNVNLKAEYANGDSLVVISEALSVRPEVINVHYKEVLFDTIDSKIGTYSIVLLIVGLLLLMIALTLIDSTIRLAMFSNRFLIKSMQLVGATKWFIIKPFISRGVVNGLISGLAASLMVFGFFVYLEHQMGLKLINDLVNFVLVVAGIIVIGVLISWISTHRAVAKYIGMRLDDLY